MLDPGALERRFLNDLPAAMDAAPPAASSAPSPALSQFQLALAVMFAVAALAVVIAAVRVTDQSIYRAVEARERDGTTRPGALKHRIDDALILQTFFARCVWLAIAEYTISHVIKLVGELIRFCNLRQRRRGLSHCRRPRPRRGGNCRLKWIGPAGPSAIRRMC